ncbi:TerB family tellurite resistance protein [Sandaracinus amylolyticus]|uniref:TerB family tellurite resistance protein n=1 Tax=Sandaracinus amylolyticus TaxID=927083 RepID=UPI001F1F720A|nr:TerB family tellurite resistance protein [Sandaracinus amylolyticus]UJR78891.1 TerB domain-containing protein [Sandaracinus amylolyticus]
MLDDRLTADERRALLFLLTSVALADGKLSDSEVRFVQRLALPVGIEVGELLAMVDEAHEGELCARLARPVAARIAVLELLRLAHVDDVYTHVEEHAIHELATRLGVDLARVEKLESWVRREWQLLSEGRRLVEES